jgi:hypothetical protein
MAATSGLDAGTHVHVDPVSVDLVAEGTPQHRPGGREGRSELVLEAELEQDRVMAGMWAGSAAKSRSMVFLPASPATAELPTCSVWCAGHLAAMSAIRHFRPRWERGSASWTSTGTRT